jgi:hypothetical protein
MQSDFLRAENEHRWLAAATSTSPLDDRPTPCLPEKRDNPSTNAQMGRLNLLEACINQKGHSDINFCHSRLAPRFDAWPQTFGTPPPEVL